MNRHASRRFVRGLLLPPILLLVVAGTDSMATIDTVTIESLTPSCDDEITLGMSGSFSDQCWTIDFTSAMMISETQFLLTVVAQDSWFPEGGCDSGLVPYEISQTFGPLPAGSYEVIGEEIVSSMRVLEGDVVVVPFDVCCDPAPPAVDDLRLEKLDEGDQIRFTWQDVADADEYVVYEDAAAGGTFDTETGVAPGGVDGLTIAMPDQTLHFLVAARNACREGPRH